MIRLRRFASIAFLSLLSASLLAHETWLAPNQGYVAPGMSVRLDMTSGGSFPILETAISPDRLATFGVRLGGEIVKPTFAAGTRSLRFTFTAPKDREGFATAFVSLKPRRLTLTPDKVAEYLDEIGQTAAFLDKWKARPEPRTWREEYSKHAKAFFRVGKSSDDSWQKPAGMGLEIVPLADPTRASSTDSFAVQALRGGEPLKDFTVVALVDPKTPRAFAVTDALGRASLKLDRPGRWLIEGTLLRESSKAGLDFESDFTTMLVTVLPPSKPSTVPAKN